MTAITETGRLTRETGTEWVYYTYRGIKIKSYFNSDIRQMYWSIVELDYKVRIGVPSMEEAIARIDASLG